MKPKAHWLVITSQQPMSVWFHNQTISFLQSRWQKCPSQGFKTELQKPVGDVAIATSIFYTVCDAESLATLTGLTDRVHP